MEHYPILISYADLEHCVPLATYACEEPKKRMGKGKLWFVVLMRESTVLLKGSRLHNLPSFLPLIPKDPFHQPSIGGLLSAVICRSNLTPRGFLLKINFFIPAPQVQRDVFAQSAFKPLKFGNSLLLIYFVIWP